MSKKKLSTLITAAAFLSLLLAGYLGLKREGSALESGIRSLVPQGSEYRAVSTRLFECYEPGEKDRVTGYITGAEADGFGGPLEVAVLVDTAGTLADIDVVSNKETLPYFEKVIRKEFLQRLEGKKFSDPFIAGDDYDAVSGATWTSVGIAEAAAEGVRLIASEQLGFDPPEKISPEIRFGLPEITLILLYLSVLTGLQFSGKIKKGIRWATLLAGMFILGFWLTVPLSINKVSQFLLGYWPDWHLHLYWYMLIFSVFGLILIRKKKYYCSWFCPFGAIQDCLAVIGGGKFRIPKKISVLLTVMQRILVWLALILALYFRTPSKFNYEIFSTVFALTGTAVLYILMAVFVIASLFIRRPWCDILCPINALSDLTLGIRKTFNKK